MRNMYVRKDECILHTLYFAYAGEVLEARMQHSLKPQRDPHHMNYISSEEYPSDVMPAFASGNLYILSQDIINYIVKNSKWHADNVRTLNLTMRDCGICGNNDCGNCDPKNITNECGVECGVESKDDTLYLNPIGSLEDVSIAIWLMSLKVLKNK